MILGVGIDLALLEEALAQRPIKACWLMGNVQHPLGHTMPDDHKQALMALLNRRGVALVEDDVYAEVYFGASGQGPSSIGIPVATACCAAPFPSAWRPAFGSAGWWPVVTPNGCSDCS